MGYTEMLCRQWKLKIIYNPDESECGSGTCQNGGECLEVGGNLTCDCLPDFTGNSCETGRFIDFTLN